MIAKDARFRLFGQKGSMMTGSVSSTLDIYLDNTCIETLSGEESSMNE